MTALEQLDRLVESQSMPTQPAIATMYEILEFVRLASQGSAEVLPDPDISGGVFATWLTGAPPGFSYEFSVDSQGRGILTILSDDDDPVQFSIERKSNATTDD